MVVQAITVPANTFVYNRWLKPGSTTWLPGISEFDLTFLGLIIYIGVIVGRTMRKTNRPDDVEICGLYWHFVDLVWMFVFPLFYLLSVNMGEGGAH